MLQGVSIPIIAKVCAALAVTTGAGVATYEIAVDTAPPKAEVAVSTEGSASSLSNDLTPDALAFHSRRDRDRVTSSYVLRVPVPNPG